MTYNEIVVNRGKRKWKSGKHQRSKQAKICWEALDPAHIWVYDH